MKIGEEKIPYQGLLKTCTPLDNAHTERTSIAAYFHNEGMPLFYIQLNNKSRIVVSTTIERISLLLLDLAFQHFLFSIPQSSSFCLPKTIFASAGRQR